MKPTLEYLRRRISVDLLLGRVYWIDATKFHKKLNGNEAGSKRRSTHSEKYYWHVKIDSVAYKRSHLVYLFSTGSWPSDQIDHINGDSLDDRIKNLRDVNQTQNAWNHKKRKKQQLTPMGIRSLKSGRFQARIAVNKQQISIGTFDNESEAFEAYQKKRKELFGEYS